MNQIPQAGEIYQHFKGKLYRIVTLATHTETGGTHFSVSIPVQSRFQKLI